MLMLTQFLKFLIGTAPELLPIVTKAITDWDVLTKGKSKALVRNISPTQEKAIDARIDAEADTARAAAGLSESDDEGEADSE